MIPLICFNCGKIGHFSSKFPYAKKSNNDEEESPKKENKYKKGDMRRIKINSSRKVSTQRRIVPH